MFEITAANGLAWAVALFFLVGAGANGAAPPAIRANYERWGYPGWFHWITAAVELTTGVLLLFPATRIAGAALGVLLMLAAAATLFRHRAFAQILAPVAVGALTALAGWLS